MATQPIAGEVVAIPGLPPMAAAHAAARLLNRHSAQEIAEAIEVLVDLLDCLGGDPEAEDDDPPEQVGDEEDAAWTEWHSRGRHKLALGTSEPFDRVGEDREDDDPPEPVGDEQDQAWIEWTLTPGPRKCRPNVATLEDAETDSAEDDFHPTEGVFAVSTLYRHENGAGCPIADPGGCEHDGREPENGF